MSNQVENDTKERVQHIPSEENRESQGNDVTGEIPKSPKQRQECFTEEKIPVVISSKDEHIHPESGSKKMIIEERGPYIEGDQYETVKVVVRIEEDVDSAQMGDRDGTLVRLIQAGATPEGTREQYILTSEGFLPQNQITRLANSETGHLDNDVKYSKVDIAGGDGKHVVLHSDSISSHKALIHSGALKSPPPLISDSKQDIQTNIAYTNVERDFLPKSSIPRTLTGTGENHMRLMEDEVKVARASTQYDKPQGQDLVTLAYQSSQDNPRCAVSNITPTGQPERPHPTPIKNYLLNQLPDDVRRGYQEVVFVPRSMANAPQHQDLEERGQEMASPHSVERISGSTATQFPTTTTDVNDSHKHSIPTNTTHATPPSGEKPHYSPNNTNETSQMYLSTPAHSVSAVNTGSEKTGHQQHETPPTEALSDSESIYRTEKDSADLQRVFVAGNSVIPKTVTLLVSDQQDFEEGKQERDGNINIQSQGQISQGHSHHQSTGDSISGNISGTGYRVVVQNMAPQGQLEDGRSMAHMSPDIAPHTQHDGLDADHAVLIPRVSNGKIGYLLLILYCSFF